MTNQELITALKAGRLPVIIYGAGIVGKVMLSLCEKNGVKVECFCDGNIKTAQVRFCGLDVVHASQLKAKYGDALFLVTVAAIKDVVDSLSASGFRHWQAAGPLLKDLDVSQHSDGAPIDYTKFALENCILCHDGYLNPDRIFLRSIDLIITERCSLRCKDCSNLMQYYQDPRNCSLAGLLKAIDALCSVADEIMDFRLIGGDVFMNREWPAVVARLASEPKARRIVLYTNGTIVPGEKDLLLLKDPKVLVIATDYGLLSKNLARLLQVLGGHKVAYHVLKPGEWLDCAGISPHNRGPAGNRELYRACCAKNMLTLSEGRIYRCPYAANAARLCAVPDFRDDYVDLYGRPPGEAGLREARAALRKFIMEKDYLETCDFCSGRPLTGPVVPSAVQSAEPLPYRKYTGKGKDMKEE